MPSWSWPAYTIASQSAEHSVWNPWRQCDTLQWLPTWASVNAVHQVFHHCIPTEEWEVFCYKVLLRVSMAPLEYWLVDGCEWPELQKIATKLFSMAMSSAAAKQNFPTLVFIHSKLCNSLSPKTVEKLVFIKSNLAAFYNLLQVVEYESSNSKNENY